MNTTVIAIILAASIFAGAFAFGHHMASESWQVKWNARDAADADATAQHERDQRALEQHYHDQLDKVQGDAQKQIDSAAADAARANDTADGLREQARRTAARCAASTVATSAATGKAASNPGMVLADLFGRADARAGELAQYADRARVAGAACERAYDGVRSAP